MPNHEPIEEKSARVVALQLIKRARDIAYRSRGVNVRKPPSVALAAMSLSAGPVQPRLIDEVISVASHIRHRLLERNGPRGTLQVFNPAYPPDEFTDRWPENFEAQDMFGRDLHRLVVGLYRLRNDQLSLEDKKALLARLFGETAATYAIESQLDTTRVEAEANRLHMGARGKVLGGVAAPAVVGTATTAARAATRMGGGTLPELPE